MPNTYTRPVAHDVPQNGAAVLARIRSSVDRLPLAGQAVAREVLDRPNDVVRTTIGRLAWASGVSSASVLRFCHALGYDGFTDFKISLASDLRKDRFGLGSSVDADDAPGDVIAKVFEADVQAIRETLDLIDADVLGRAVQALARAERIEVYGVGSSAPIAQDAHYRLLRLGLQVGSVTDAHMQAVSASLLDPRAVALVISHTGRTRETLDSAREAHASGATVIGLTSYFGTPLLAHCDLPIVTATSETTLETEAMASRIAHLAVIDVLHVMLARVQPERSLSTLDRTRVLIERKRT